MRLAYGDLIGGISGDMFVAALIDLGLPLGKLKAELKKIPTLTFALKTAKKTVHAVRATRFQVICPRQEPPRSWQQIRRLLERSKLSAPVKTITLDIFTRLAQAEAKIHGVAVDHVHFHEVGATDSIVDIVAAAIGVRELAIDQLHFSRIPLGRGLTRSQHGPLPVPGPATMELLKGLPTFGIDLDSETVTPTGAALLKVLGSSFGDQPAMIIDKIGYGTGQKEFPNRPNLFRLSIGTNAANLQHEEMLVIETNIDDMTPQHFDHVMERLFAAGARDVFLAPIQMKKNRPATLLTVICELAQRDRLATVILQETTTIGVR
ncbi:MAG: nickel pincer cofactor biosynthesis protein LarC, partial [Candidatus Binatia bacterium]